MRERRVIKGLKKFQRAKCLFGIMDFDYEQATDITSVYFTSETQRNTLWGLFTIEFAILTCKLSQP